MRRSDDLSRGVTRNPDFGLSPHELMERYREAAGAQAGAITAAQARSLVPPDASDAEAEALAQALVDLSEVAFELAAQTYKAEPSGEPFLPFAVRRIASATELYLRSHHFPRRLS